MWPLLLTSVTALAVVLDRILFMLRTGNSRRVEDLKNILSFSETGQMDQAVSSAEQTTDFVARVLIHGLKHRRNSLSGALLQAANAELKQFNRGLPTLDTIITLAPLLGLLGTVTGMIRAFGLLGQKELEAPTVITGGIAEALIATAFGLGIAIVALVAFNFFNNRLEDARIEIEHAATQLELNVQAQKGREQ